MTKKERVFHSLLFELLSIILFITLASLVSDKHAVNLGGLAIALSSAAVIWNYYFNIWFDSVYGLDKHKRSLKVRIIHGLMFEGGIIIISTPMFMWVLDVSLVTAFIMDLAATAIFVVFTILFNWLYDSIRYKIVTNNTTLLKQE
jgi:uncharacterized membrane protein